MAAARWGSRVTVHLSGLSKDAGSCRISTTSAPGPGQPPDLGTPTNPTDNQAPRPGYVANPRLSPPPAIAPKPFKYAE